MKQCATSRCGFLGNYPWFSFNMAFNETTWHQLYTQNGSCLGSHYSGIHARASSRRFATAAMKSKETVLRAVRVVRITRISGSCIQVRVETGDFAARLRLNRPNNRAIGWRAKGLNAWFERLAATCRRGAVPIFSGKGCLSAFRVGSRRGRPRLAETVMALKPQFQARWTASCRRLCRWLPGRRSPWSRAARR